MLSNKKEMIKIHVPKFINDGISKSNNTFTDVVEPVLLELMGGEFIVVEGVTDPVYVKMDLLSGIDILHVSDKGIRGIASRVQYGKAWDTFTVRTSRESGKETEYAKRQWSIDNEYIYPYYTLQAYVSNDDELLSLAVAKTKDVMDMVEQGKCIKRQVYEDGRSATFAAVKWDAMQDVGYEVEVYRYKKFDILF